MPLADTSADDQQTKHLFAHFGLAMCLGQSLIQSLAVLDMHGFTIPADLADDITKARLRHTHLAATFFTDRDLLIANRYERAVMIGQLEEAQALFFLTTRKLVDALGPAMRSSGARIAWPGEAARQYYLAGGARPDDPYSYL